MAEKRAPAKKSSARRKAKPAPPPSPFATERELIVVTNPAAAVRASAHGVESAVAAPAVTSLNDVLATAGVVLRPLFGMSEERVASLSDSIPPMDDDDGSLDFASYYRAEASDDQLDDLAASLIELDSVEGAFVAPGAEPAVYLDEEDEAASVAEALEEAPPINTPDFTARQTYLNAAPAGIDARFAWTVPGGSGANVRIIDIEGAWRFSHEDLRQNQGGVIGGTPSSELGWRNHGTAVIGEFGGDRNSFGVTGICPDANTRAISIFGGVGAAGAIVQAANALRAGDIILIELHRPGPRFNFTRPNGQRGFIAMEWWPDVFAAIRFAVGRGVVVVEAAGNGAEDFDDPLYNTPGPGFPASWRNPFNPANPSSQAVVVGAGAPPPGTHGRNHGTDRSRLGFSNYGARVDVQGWGREVTTTGYGDLQGGANEDEWYTDKFSGTSSASPIVVGALGCVQGARRAASIAPLSSPQAISLLRGSGSPQQATPGRPASQRIGNRPNLRQLLPRVTPPTTVPVYRYWNGRIGDHFYTTNWGELGRGRSGYRYEGVQCWVRSRRAAGTVPLYRYWNGRIGDHFYTTNWGELGRGRSGYRYEGIQCWVRSRRAAGTVPLYRYWNGRIGDHFYTTNWGELGRGRSGYRYEGIQCWVYRRRTSAPSVPGDDGALDVFEPDAFEPADFDDGFEPPAFDAEVEPAPDDAFMSGPSSFPGDTPSFGDEAPTSGDVESSFGTPWDDGPDDGDPPPDDDDDAIVGSFDTGDGGGGGSDSVTVNVNINRPD